MEEGGTPAAVCVNNDTEVPVVVSTVKALVVGACGVLASSGCEVMMGTVDSQSVKVDEHCFECVLPVALLGAATAMMWEFYCKY